MSERQQLELTYQLIISDSTINLIIDSHQWLISRCVEGIIGESHKYTRFAHTTVSYQKKLEKKVVLPQLGGHTAKICRLSLHTSNLSEVKIGGA